MCVEAGPQRAPTIVVLCVACDRDHWNIGVGSHPAQPLDELVAIHLRHADVGNYQIEGLFACKLKGVCSPVSGNDLIPCMPQEQPDHICNIVDVIDHQNATLQITWPSLSGRPCDLSPGSCRAWDKRHGRKIRDTCFWNEGPGIR